jgi:hypothetical protein
MLKSWVISRLRWMGESSVELAGKSGWALKYAHEKRPLWFATPSGSPRSGRWTCIWRLARARSM